MQFEYVFDFDYSASIIMRMYSDRDYFVQKYRTLGGAEPEVLECQEDDERFSITVRHPLDATELPLPDFLRKRVGQRLMLHQTDAWHLPTRTGRVEIEFESLPLFIGIDMHVIERDAGSRHNLTFDVQADVPVLGKRIEKSMAEPLKHQMHVDLEESARMAASYVQP